MNKSDKQKQIAAQLESLHQHLEDAYDIAGGLRDSFTGIGEDEQQLKEFCNTCKLYPMSRPVTAKWLQHHTECVCGHGEVDGFTSVVSTHKELTKQGFKRKKSKNDGSVFYLLYYYIPQCLDNHNEPDDTIDDDLENIVNEAHGCIYI